MLTDLGQLALVIVISYAIGYRIGYAITSK